jgi:hypothetical protein
MRAKHLTLFVLGLGIFAAASEIKPMLNQAFSSRIEIGELQPGVKIYFVAKNESENTNNGTQLK